MEHLLNFVDQSGCTIHRNGRDNPASEARVQIRKKYDDYRDNIHIIDYAASRSALSVKPCTVTRPGRPTVPTRQWLREELARYRASKHN